VGAWLAVLVRRALVPEMPTPNHTADGPRHRSRWWTTVTISMR